MKSIIIIGGGPAGLMAAEIIATAGHKVTIHDRMPSVGRKFLMAGRGGLNLTHSEEIETFIARYGKAAAWLEPILRHFPPASLIAWCHDLGQETFVGSSGRVFPKSMKASPLLRAWLRRLDRLGVAFSLRSEWLGWEKDKLIFKTAGRKSLVEADAVLLALGGGSWPKLGSDGGWVDILGSRSVKLAPLLPSNCGFTVKWSKIFREKFEGRPLKPVALSFGDKKIQGEVTITAKGIEGGAVYALSSALRDAIIATGAADLSLDLKPALSEKELTAKLEKPRGSQSLATHLKKQAGLSPVAIGLLHETTPLEELRQMKSAELAERIKACPLRLTGIAPIERAISTAGGIQREALDEHLMLKNLPGVFAAGEMLDWEAPTGGYLLQASFATAVTAAEGLLVWLKNTSQE